MKAFFFHFDKGAASEGKAEVWVVNFDGVRHTGTQVFIHVPVHTVYREGGKPPAFMRGRATKMEKDQLGGITVK